MHLQFLRGGEAGDAVDYDVTATYDGRTTAARRVDSRQHGRLLTTATVSFAAPMAGPEHGRHPLPSVAPDALDRTGPPGPAPSVPLDELDIRVADDGTGEEFVRRLWWRATAALPDDPLLHTLIAVYVTDLYMIDPALQVHGHSMRARTHRSGTTDSSVWFHQPVRADAWNLLESSRRRPPGARRHHGEPRPHRRGRRGDPGPGGAHRGAGTATELTLGLRSRSRRRTSVTACVRSTPTAIDAATPSAGWPSNTA